MTGSWRDRKDWITGTTKVQTALHTNMYLPDHENRDRHRATGEVFVYAKPLRTTGWRMASVPIFLTGFRWEQNPDFRPHDENCMTKRVRAYSSWGIKHIGRLAAKIVRNLFRQIFDAKNLNAPPVKSMPPTGLADDSQSGNAPDSVVGCRMIRNLFDGFSLWRKTGYLTSWRK